MRAVLLGFLSVVALQALLVGVVALQALLVGVLLSAHVAPLHGLRCLDLTQLRREQGCRFKVFNCPKQAP